MLPLNDTPAKSGGQGEHRPKCELARGICPPIRGIEEQPELNGPEPAAAPHGTPGRSPEPGDQAKQRPSGNGALRSCRDAGRSRRLDPTVPREGEGGQPARQAAVRPFVTTLPGPPPGACPSPRSRKDATTVAPGITARKRRWTAWRVARR